jgi:hypothetical protein
MANSVSRSAKPESKRAAADCKKDGHPYFYNPFGASYDRYTERFSVWLFLVQSFYLA